MTTSGARGTALLFDPMRLRIARQGAMLRKKDVAELVGVSAAAISQYEKGSSKPSTRVVAALSLALGTPVEFFSADRPLGEAPATTPHFRSLRSTTQQERDRAFVHALLTWELTRTLERHVKLPVLDLPEHLAVRVDEPIARVEEAARETRNYWNIGLGPIPHAARLLESRGIVCTRLPAQTQRVFAFSCAFPSRPVVVLASERSPRAASRFDTVHELAHLVLHHDEEPGSHAVERQAHAFAAEFLTPADEIAERLPRTANWPQLLELKAVWGVSMQALLYRARSLGVMAESTYRRSMTEVSARGWRKHEPGDDAVAEQPILLRKALDVIAQHGLTIDDLAKEARLASTMLSLIVGGDNRPAVSVSEVVRLDERTI